MVKLVFVVLHYSEKVLNDTFQCIDSILEIKCQEMIKIVIVENGSNDDSFKILSCKYKDFPSINIKRNYENLGFARGNNEGVNYARRFNPKYIFVINNDTIILQDTILELIEIEYSIYSFDILGPQIISPSKRNQSPIVNTLNSIENIDIQLKKYNFLKKKYMKKISFYLVKNKIIYTLKKLRILYMLVKKIKIKMGFKYSYIDYCRFHNDLMLHGSAIIFSSNYLKKYDDAFHPETFLYHEENIIDYIVKRDNLVRIYTPKISILHKEDISTNAVIHKNSKQLFKLNHSLDSLNVLKKIMYEDIQEIKHIVKSNNDIMVRK